MGSSALYYSPYIIWLQKTMASSSVWGTILLTWQVPLPTQPSLFSVSVSQNVNHDSIVWSQSMDWGRCKYVYHKFLFFVKFLCCYCRVRIKRPPFGDIRMPLNRGVSTRYIIRLIRHVVFAHPLSSCVNNKGCSSCEYQYSAMNIILGCQQLWT